MPALELICTNDVAPRARVGFWNQAVSETVRDVTADPLDPRGFCGRLARLSVSDLQFVEICGDPSRVTRPHCASPGQHFVLEMLLSGEYSCHAEGTEHVFRPGDFWFIPPTKCVMRIPTRTRILSLRIPRARLVPFVAAPDALTAVVMSGSQGPGAVVSGYLQHLWQQIRDEQLPERRDVFAGIALKLIATAFSGIENAGVDATTTVARHLHRIRLYIEEHLQDPALTPATLAASLRITQSYLHRLFSTQDESVSRYILRRRLEECHLELGDCGPTPRRITDIALRQGFSSLSHFCRAFRERYGITPGELARSSPATFETVSRRKSRE